MNQPRPLASEIVENRIINLQIIKFSVEIVVSVLRWSFLEGEIREIECGIEAGWS